ncbi:MAG: hypothetical protein MUC90_03090 [Thermoplasmata archaeon]|nr:hypothetical protein [Thermoplasmata archaeon]
MRLLLELSMECESLARAEALATSLSLDAKSELVHAEPGIVIVETGADPVILASRLGLCHHVGEWMSTCSYAEVEAAASDLAVPGPIRVRSTKVGEVSVDLAAVSRRVGSVMGKGRGVDLRAPKTDIRVVFSQKAHLSRLMASVDRPAFERRKNRYLPFTYPASLHPKFARAMVNLTMARPGQRILDPFCGTGAIVAETSLCGFRALGTDFSERMIEGAERNLAHISAGAALTLCDVGAIKEKVGRVEGIATDPPYGRSTSTDGEGIPDLYSRAFRAFSEVLGKGSRVVIVVPDMDLLHFADRFRLTQKHELWVHRSLTRNFCVLERT